MKRYDRCARSFLFLASIGLLPVSAGYAQEVHKAARLPYTTSYQATAPMACATYYFFVNGSDPLHVGKLNQMTRRFDCLPNSHAEYFNMAQHHKIRQRISEVRCQQPHARIVLVGFSCGCNICRSVCHHLHTDGVWVDYLVYIAGESIRNTVYSRPENVGCILNITGHGSFRLQRDMMPYGDTLTGATNVHLNAGHFQVPQRDETYDLILQYTQH